MNILKERLEQAFEAKHNDVKNFVWKFERQPDGYQPSIKMMDATPEQLIQFYERCEIMLHNTDPEKPGRYELLNIISDQRRKCTAELLLRGLETGALCADGRSYPRRLYIQDIRAYMKQNKKDFPTDQLYNIPISAVTNGLPREYERLSIEEVINAGLDALGTFDNKHITFGFIINMGVYVTRDEMSELNIKDSDGNLRKKPEVIKERLGLRPSVNLTIKPSGLNLKELRAMLNLKKKKYSELTTDQLNTLLNKVLFRLENEVSYHIKQWEERKRQILLVMQKRNISFN